MPIAMLFTLIHPFNSIVDLFHLLLFYYCVFALNISFNSIVDLYTGGMLLLGLGAITFNSIVDL